MPFCVYLLILTLVYVVSHHQDLYGKHVGGTALWQFLLTVLRYRSATTLLLMPYIRHGLLNAIVETDVERRIQVGFVHCYSSKTRLT